MVLATPGNSVGETPLFDVLFIGAGIVGLASAYQLLKKYPHLKIAVVEKEKRPALHQTGRNSGVVHSGVYYKPGSLKARNCLRGKELLLSFCEEEKIPFQRVGKVIVAQGERERGQLLEVEAKGRANGIRGLQRVGREQLREIEPEVVGDEALWVPEVAILSYPEVAERIALRLQERGASLFFGHRVLQFKKGGVVETDRGAFRTQFLVNCAGVYSDQMARRSLPEESLAHQILPFRGEYYEVIPEKRHLVKGLIYPVPDPQFPFLGVHLTRMIDGKVEAGPNAVLSWAKEGYRRGDVHLKEALQCLSYRGFWKLALRHWKMGAYEMWRSWNKRVFVRDVQRLIPSLQESDFIPGGSGIRAQAVGRDGKLLDDFAFVRREKMLHVINAPSPAATASFAIGEEVVRQIEETAPLDR